MTNFMNHMFNVGLVNGIPVLYTYYRINKNLYDDRLHLYDIQSLDDGMTPKNLAPFVRIHHWGSVISKVPLVEEGQYAIDIEDTFVETDEYMYLDEYLSTELVLNNNQIEMRL